MCLALGHDVRFTGKPWRKSHVIFRIATEERGLKVWRVDQAHFSTVKVSGATFRQGQRAGSWRLQQFAG